LCERYLAEFTGLNTGKPIPKLVVGHSHEPRQNAGYLEGGLYKVRDYYLIRDRRPLPEPHLVRGRFRQRRRIVSWSMIADG